MSAELDAADVEILDLLAKELRNGDNEGYAQRLYALMARLSPGGLAYFKHSLNRVKAKP